jgi:hypothetical protein
MYCTYNMRLTADKYERITPVTFIPHRSLVFLGFTVEGKIVWRDVMRYHVIYDISLLCVMFSSVLEVTINLFPLSDKFQAVWAF